MNTPVEWQNQLSWIDQIRAFRHVRSNQDSIKREAWRNSPLSWKVKFRGKFSWKDKKSWRTLSVAWVTRVFSVSKSVESAFLIPELNSIRFDLVVTRSQVSVSSQGREWQATQRHIDHFIYLLIAKFWCKDKCLGGRSMWHWVTQIDSNFLIG